MLGEKIFIIATIVDMIFIACISERISKKYDKNAVSIMIVSSLITLLALYGIYNIIESMGLL